MSLILSCSSESAKRGGENPLLATAWDTPFEIAPFEQIEAEHYLEAFEVAFEEKRADIERITSSDEVSWEGVIWALDDSGIRLRELKDLFEMSEAAISSESYRAVSAEVMPKIAAAEDAVWMNDALFAKVKSVYERREEMELDDQQRRLLEKTYTKFVRGGAELNSSDKERLAKINEEIALLCSRFSQNLLAENDAFYLKLGARELEGLPNAFRNSAKAAAREREVDGWVVGLNPSMMVPFMTYSNKRELREQLYTAYLKRGANGGETDNSEIVRRVTELRQERAKMLGYENHADYVISQQMAGSVEAAYELLNKLWEPALESAKMEHKELLKLLTKDDPTATLEPWDWWYYTEQLRNSKYKLKSEEVSQYFKLENVRGGAFDLANRLYGITFRPIQAPLYHEDCVVYEVTDRDNHHLGVLYFDLYARSNKGQGAWCGNLREQRTEGGDRITPVVAIVCNFPRPSGTTPSLLSVEQVETLFHEFGHAMHFLFQNVDYHGLAAVEGDFVEFPSQVMENWVLEPEFLAMYAVHYNRGVAMPDVMVNKLQQVRKFNQGYETLSITAAALLDLDLQTTTSFDGFEIESFEREALRERRGLIEPIEPRYHLTNFAHLFSYDYSAGYYFYLWAEVLDKDAFAAFKSSGDLFSKRYADRLQREILRRGSEADGMTLYRNFRGGEPSELPMLEARGLIK